MIDIDSGLLNGAKAAYVHLPNVTFKVADAKNLSSFEDGSFDRILALGLFAHVLLQDVPRAFAEFWRVCRPGGIVIVTNSTKHFKDVYLDAAFQYGFELRMDEEGKCRASDTGLRYLFVFAKSRSGVSVS